MKIAITGGIGSGKSSVCKLLAEALPEFTLYSIDEAVRITKESPEVVFIIHERYDKWIHGDMKNLSDAAFAHPEMRKGLEYMMMPFIMKIVGEWLSSDKDILMEFPLLYEMESEKNYDLVVSVSASVATRTARVINRNGVSLEKIAAIMAVQKPQEEKDTKSDLIFVNENMSLEEMSSRVQELAHEINKVRKTWKRSVF